MLQNTPTATNYVKSTSRISWQFWHSEFLWHLQVFQSFQTSVVTRHVWARVSDQWTEQDKLILTSTEKLNK